MSFFDLLILIVPEVLVLVTGLVVLTVDLAEMRHQSAKARFTVAAALTTAGCLVTMFWLAEAYSGHQTRTSGGMLVIDPLVIVVKQAVLGLTVFTA